MSDVTTKSETTATRRKVRVGKVVSNKADKTIVVSIERQVAHPLYRKYFKQTTKVMAHDEKNEFKTGDRVEIMEHSPISKQKRWTLVEKVDASKA